MTQTPTSLRNNYLFNLVESHRFTHPLCAKSFTISNVNDFMGPIDFYIPLSTISVDINSVTNEKPKDEIARRFSAFELLNKYSRLIILGDPGSGKSMLLNFVLICLAGESLKLPNANIINLTTPPVLERGKQTIDFGTRIQLWEHGALIPIYVDLHDFILKFNLNASDNDSSETLWMYIEETLKNNGLQPFTRELRDEITNAGGILMLDGLDEVTRKFGASKMFKNIIEDFAQSYPKCRIVIAGRNSTYQRQSWHFEGFNKTLLAPFSNSHIICFIENWFECLSRMRVLNVSDSQHKASTIIKTILEDDNLLVLARSPLLLALMLYLKTYNDDFLPKTREEIRSSMVEMSYSIWENFEFYTTATMRKRRRLSLAKLLQIDSSRIKDLLNELAYLNFIDQTCISKLTILEKNLAVRLMQLNKNPKLNSQNLLTHLRRRQGLLSHREDKTYEFSHQICQSFLVGCWISQHIDLAKAIDLFIREPEKSEDVAISTIYCSANKSIFQLDRLISLMMSQEIPQFNDQASSSGLILAGKIMQQIEEHKGPDRQINSSKNRVRQGLLKLINSKRDFSIDRTNAGNILDKLGDPRFDPKHWYLPKDDILGFNFIPMSKFWMGSDDTLNIAEIHEKPIHQVRLNSYWIARYPVTVSQFAIYNRECGRQLAGVPGNSPIVHVTWFNALEYCNWLQEKLVGFAKKRMSTGGIWTKIVDGSVKVVLPSEAEWEKASRGIDHRIYPWKDRNNLINKANVEMNIGTTCTVGCFAGGTSPYGVMDMTGNIWEWTRSIWGQNWEKPEFIYPYDPYDGRESLTSHGFRILRGGCFLSSWKSCRCSNRLRLNPNNKDDHIGFRLAITSID